MVSEGLLILPDWLVVSGQEAPFQGWGVRVLGSKIDDVAPHAELQARYPEAEVWNASGKVLAPGFVDAHTHLYGVLAHGIPLEQSPLRFLAVSGRVLVAIN